MSVKTTSTKKKSSVAKRTNSKRTPLENTGPVAISFILNAHNEGGILVPAIRSAVKAKEICTAQGIRTEIIAVGDKVDVATQANLENFKHEFSKLLYCEAGNLGVARQLGLDACCGEFVCFLDGDDVWQADWPSLAFQAMQRRSDPRNCVLHTEVFAGFGSEMFFRKQIRSTDSVFHPLNLSITWHFCNNLFCHRSIFDRIKISPYEHNAGYGSEDWHWSCETLTHGIERDYVPETAYFYRIDHAKASLGKTLGLALKPTSLFSDPLTLGSYGKYVGVSSNPTIEEFRLIGSMVRKEEPAPWLYKQLEAACEFEYLLYNSLKQFHSAATLTPRLNPAAAYVFSRIAQFSNSPVVYVGLDCENIDADRLSLLMHGIRNVSNLKKVVVLCGSRLSLGELIRQADNVLFVNYKALLQLDEGDSYAVNQMLINVMSNFTPEQVFNVNSEYLDYFAGRYARFLLSNRIRTSRYFYSNVADLGTSYWDRRVLGNIQQGIFWYDELWVSNEESEQYLKSLYELLSIKIGSLANRPTDELIPAIVMGLPFVRERKDEELARAPVIEEPVEISCVLNAHREGKLMMPTLHSMNRMIAYAKKRGVGVEVVVVLDNTDQATRDLVQLAIKNSLLPTNTQLLEVEHKDLGCSRRKGVEAARGQYIGFFDADDLYSENWLAEALRTVRSSMNSEVVCHPEINIYFGNNQRLFWHPDEQRHKDLPYAGLLLENYWTSLSFARKETYLNHPILNNNIHEGYGYEDWHWNMDAVTRKIVHRAVQHTCHFIRLKPSGSLNQLSSSKGVITRPSDFARQLIFDKNKKATMSHE